MQAPIALILRVLVSSINSVPETSVPQAAMPPRRPRPRVWVAAGAAAALVLFGTILYVTTDNGTIKIELIDPDAKVEIKVDGETMFAADKPTQALTGLSSADVRRSRVQAPGSLLWLEFIEFKNVERTPLRMKIQDRGAARLQLRTESIDAMVAAVKHAGLSVATEGAVAVPIPPNMKGALVADPNNFFVTLFEACDGCAPREIPATR